MKTIGVIANTRKPNAEAVLQKLAEKARALGMTLLTDDAPLGLSVGIRSVGQGALCTAVDAIMALGGDGTMLRAVREIDGHDIPLVGLNIGSLGFLTSIAEEDLGRAMDCLARDDYRISHRSLLECVVLDGEVELARYHGLNDFVIGGGASMRVVTLDVTVDDDHVASYVCDGLVVSTPTGSTGHSLSAGGPIIVPETRAFVISLICPHTLSSRPVVVPDTSVIAVRGEVSHEDGMMRVMVDGQVGRNVTREHRILVRRADRDVRFIHLPGYSYFSVLRQKMRWSGSAYR